MRLEVCLQGNDDSSSVSLGDRENAEQSSGSSTAPVAEVVSFLKRNKTAKIIYIIDTHSMDNGFFAYTGDSPKDYMACSLEEVSTTCISWTAFARLTCGLDCPGLHSA